MTPPRFQFTIRGLLWAMFWLAVAIAGWNHDSIMPFWAFTFPLAPRGLHFVITAATIAAYVVVASLCAAGGAMWGHHRTGLLIGLIAVAGSVCSTMIEMLITGGL